jgi:hypothetical protein
MKEPQNLCHGQINLHFHKIKTSSYERDRKWEKKSEISVRIM